MIVMIVVIVMIVMIVMIVIMTTVTILPATQLRKVRGCFQGDCDDDDNDDVGNHCDSGNYGRKHEFLVLLFFFYAETNFRT